MLPDVINITLCPGCNMRRIIVPEGVKRSAPAVALLFMCELCRVHVVDDPYTCHLCGGNGTNERPFNAGCQCQQRARQFRLDIMSAAH